MNEKIKERISTIVEIDNDAHLIIKNKQNEIFNRTKKNTPIRIIVSEAVKKGINLIEI